MKTGLVGIIFAGVADPLHRSNTHEVSNKPSATSSHVWAQRAESCPWRVTYECEFLEEMAGRYRASDWAGK
jgi:hypothetical protein